VQNGFDNKKQSLSCADLDYAGLYDRNNEEFLGVFSDDFSRFFLLNESVEVDLTSIDARMPYDWKQ
jgi:hypothetical protein|tara:strand:+ start:203 stop:400 length:198 start_codon:yes stop_codon:yes gene_type:complete